MAIKLRVGKGIGGLAKGAKTFTPGVAVRTIRKKGIGGFVRNAVRTAGAPVKNVAKAVEKSADAIKKIPIAGQLFSILTIQVSFYSHLVNMSAAMARGQRIDRAALQMLKKQAGELRTAAQFAPMVVSFVPGVGTGIAAGLAAGIALSDGRPLSKALVEGIKHAIPGGAIAQAAFSVAQGAIEGKKIEQIAINALPISPQARQALISGLELTKDIASGKKLDKALLARADDAIRQLPAVAGRAMQIGMATSIAKKAQDTIVKEISSPAARNVIAQVGSNISKANAMVAAGQKLDPSKKYLAGFDLGTGLVNGQGVTQTMIVAARHKLDAAVKKGFDTALAFNIGRVSNRGEYKASNPAEAFGFLSTIGLAGAADHQKVAIMKEIIHDPQSREGAKTAIKLVATTRKGKETIWESIKRILFGTTKERK